MNAQLPTPSSGCQKNLPDEGERQLCGKKVPVRGRMLLWVPPPVPKSAISPGGCGQRSHSQPWPRGQLGRDVTAAKHRILDIDDNLFGTKPYFPCILYKPSLARPQCSE